MSTQNAFTKATLLSFNTEITRRRQLLEQASIDVGALWSNYALDSFVSTFLDTSDSLFDVILSRLEKGQISFEKQLEDSSMQFTYTDHNGCQWLFDRNKPHLGWV